MQKAAIIATASVLALSSAAASADIITFNHLGGGLPGGTISYDGNGGSLVGKDIGLDTAGMQGGKALDCQSCVINFKSGKLISHKNGMYQFGDGGYFAVAGDLYDGDTKVSNGQQLALGKFSRTPFVFKTGKSGFSFTGSGTSEGYGAIFQYFYHSIDNDVVFSSTAISGTTVSFEKNGGFSGDIGNVDLGYNVDTANSVPEPSPFGIFGVGLGLIAGALGFRRKQQPRQDAV